MRPLNFGLRFSQSTKFPSSRPVLLLNHADMIISLVLQWIFVDLASLAELTFPSSKFLILYLSDVSLTNIHCIKFYPDEWRPTPKYKSMRIVSSMLSSHQTTEKCSLFKPSKVVIHQWMSYLLCRWRRHRTQPMSNQSWYMQFAPG